MGCPSSHLTSSIYIIFNLGYLCLGLLYSRLSSIIKGKLIVLYTYAQREVWSCIQSVQVSLMDLSLEGSYRYSSQAGLQDFILGSLNGRKPLKGGWREMKGTDSGFQKGEG